MAYVSAYEFKLIFIKLVLDQNTYTISKAAEAITIDTHKMKKKNWKNQFWLHDRVSERSTKE